MWITARTSIEVDGKWCSSKCAFKSPGDLDCDPSYCLLFRDKSGRVRQLKIDKNNYCLRCLACMAAPEEDKK